MAQTEIGTAQVVLTGTAGDDLLDGSGYALSVVIRALEGDDTLIGGAKNDRLSGGDGHNLLYGGGGDDMFFVKPNPLEFNTIHGGSGHDSLIVTLTAAQYADPAIRAALSQLDYFMARQAADPTAQFVSDALHLTVSGVEQAEVRVESALHPVSEVVPGAFALYFQNQTQSYLGRDYTLVARWVVDGAAFVSGSNLPGVDRNWSVLGTADFNGDLKSDLLWQDSVSGALSIWTMDGDTALHGNTVFTPAAGAGWQFFGTGDFNGDGRADLLLSRTATNPATGQAYDDLRLVTLEADGQTFRSNEQMATAASGWSVIGIGDFDGDGKSDLLWRDAAGHVAIWEMNGTAFVRGDTVASVDAGWSVAGIGDFDGDGRSDILWHNTDGNVAIWEMNGLVAKAGATITNAGPDWVIAGVADYNGDGRSDILWRHVPVAGIDTSEIQVWTMNGLTVTHAGTLAYVPNEWQVV